MSTRHSHWPPDLFVLRVIEGEEDRLAEQLGKCYSSELRPVKYNTFNLRVNDLVLFHTSEELPEEFTAEIPGELDRYDREAIELSLNMEAGDGCYWSLTEHKFGIFEFKLHTPPEEV